MKPEEYTRHQQQLVGWAIEIETYRLGEMYHTTVSSLDAGARFARADGSTQLEAEGRALEKAERYLKLTRRF